MLLTCQEAIGQYMRALSAEFKCIPVDDRLRIVTPYVYPDNSLIELFVEELAEGEVRVSDLGETFRHLHALGFEVAAFPKRRQMAEIIAGGTGVQVILGQLVKNGPVDELGDVFLDVAASARGVADLIYTVRTYEPATFVEEVGTFLDENKLNYEPGVKLTGETGKIYTVHFKIPVGPVYIQALSPKQVGATKPQVDATFRMWFDCNGNLGRHAKVSVLNDVDFRWREYDVALLERVSQVAFWSKRAEQLVRFLRKAQHI